MSPESKLQALFLEDTYKAIRSPDCDAVKAVMRLRLYIAVTDCGSSLKELFRAGGFSNREYDAFLALYNRQLAHRMI